MKPLYSLIALCFLSAMAHAQTVRLDDSTSPRSRVAPRAIVDENGTPLQRSLEPDHAVLRFGQVIYRLDMRPHMGHRAIIYFARASENGPPSGSRMNWATAGGQQTGSLLSGERALMWSGRITQAWMEFPMHLELDYNLLRWRPQPGQSSDHVTWFELERLP